MTPIGSLGYTYNDEEIKEHEFFKAVAGDLLTNVVQLHFISVRDNGHIREAHCASTTTICRQSRVPSSSHWRVLRALLWPDAGKFHHWWGERGQCNSGNYSHAVLVWSGTSYRGERRRQWRRRSGIAKQWQWHMKSPSLVEAVTGRGVDDALRKTEVI